MFVLSKISDVIRLDPSTFAIKTSEALEDAINAKYANKVVHNLGLCICLYDIESIGDGSIKPGDGAMYVKSMRY
jgi:DNA-directed RNA polymerase III subunit RPC8